jgi:hypothetical protein
MRCKASFLATRCDIRPPSLTESEWLTETTPPFSSAARILLCCFADQLTLLSGNEHVLLLLL